MTDDARGELGQAARPALSGPMLSMRGVTKSFDGVQALRGADFDVAGGEVHALLGENGAGKSTLMKVLAGAIQPDAGEITIDGRPVLFQSRQDSMRMGINMIFQHVNLVDDLTIAENISLGVEPRRYGLNNTEQARQRARSVFERLELDLDVDRLAGGLRAGEKQLVEIARSLSQETRLLVMDEPTASLGSHEVEILFRIVRDLRARGVGIIYISHRLDELEAISDRVTVLRDGRTVATSPTATTSRAAMIETMIGRERGHVYRKQSHARPHTALRVQALSTDSGLSDISFDLHEGEVLGVYGLLGSGRTELARALFGADPWAGGTVQLGEESYHPRSPVGAARSGFGFVPEERTTQGIFSRLSILENVLSANGRLVSRWGLVNGRRERELVRQIVAETGIKTPSIEQPVGLLSGGNQQKVVMARWLLASPRILILDDPTVGVDVNAKDELYRMIAGLTVDGTSVLLLSSELPEVMGLSDRILVLRDGTLAATLDASTSTEADVLAAAIGEAQ